MDEGYKGPIELSLEIFVEKVESLLSGDYYFSRRTVALLLLQGDAEIYTVVGEKEPRTIDRIEKILAEAKTHFANPISFELALERQAVIRDIIDKTVVHGKSRFPFREKLSRITMSPATGLPILGLILYWGIYKFVGDFGAGTVVDFLEGTVFEKYINPFIVRVFESAVPWDAVRSLFTGEYGIFTLGFRYALALILPLVTLFFVVFSVIEDSGYLPRLAMLLDRTFKKIGLSGRAVIPMVLGFGCDTMATMVTRTLPTKKERVIATMLLALAVPCSAQLGVIMALLEGKPALFFVWVFVICSVFVFIGFLTARLLPGESPSFYMELPSLRVPHLKNVFVKTYVRVKWYLMEVIPLFLLASVLIWLGKLTRIFDFLVNVLRKPVELVGLPPETAEVFLFGFFRRDYGAVGLYDLNKQGTINDVQLVVACITLTLFLPCIAQFLMTVKERGWKTGLGISFFILFFSFGVAYMVNMILTAAGIFS